jgi:hypothetical protein
MQTADLDRAKKRAEAAREMAQRGLELANRIIKAHARDPVFQKRIAAEKGFHVLVSLSLSGAVQLHNATTGELLAESEPGQPTVLREGFVPPPLPCA